MIRGAGTVLSHVFHRLIELYRIRTVLVPVVLAMIIIEHRLRVGCTRNELTREGRKAMGCNCSCSRRARVDYSASGAGRSERCEIEGGRRLQWEAGERFAGRRRRRVRHKIRGEVMRKSTQFWAIRARHIDIRATQIDAVITKWHNLDSLQHSRLSGIWQLFF